jgi:hypothetical protein
VKNDNNDTECVVSHSAQDAKSRQNTNKKHVSSEVRSTSLDTETSSVPAEPEYLCESGVINELRRRWPGIVVLADKPLGDGLGVAVYFTFPGGNRMAAWVSGTNEVGVSPEDRKHWKAFIAKCETPTTP